MTIYVITKVEDGRVIKAYTSKKSAENTLQHICRNDGTYKVTETTLLNIEVS